MHQNKKIKNLVARLTSLANRNLVPRLARIITNFNSGVLGKSCKNFGSNTNFLPWITILLVCESRKLHNISHFSLLAILALIFSREVSLIFHKILARKNYETRLAVIPTHNTGLLLPKTTSACIFTRIKRKIVFFFFSSILRFRETRLFRKLGSFAKLWNSRNSYLIFANHNNRFVANFAKFSRNEISSQTLHARLYLQRPRVHLLPNRGRMCEKT